MATTASPSSLAARPRGLVLSLAAAAAAFPIAVLTHELGHFLVYLLLGLPGVELHSASVSFAGSEAFWEHIRAGDRARAAQIAPVAGVAAAIGAGLTISFITVLACTVLAWRGRTHPFIAGLGLAASLRFLMALPALLVTVAAAARPPFFCTDSGLRRAARRECQNIIRHLCFGLGAMFRA